MNCNIDHAHPLMIAGHPFKGGAMFSTAYLQHPDMKFFAINDSTAFLPPRPTAVVTTLGAPAAESFPSFADFFRSYFSGASMYTSNPKASVMLEGMKKCYENNAKNPVDQCQYYIQGFERFTSSS